MSFKNTEPSKPPGLFKRLTGTSFPNPFRKVKEVPVPQSQENREEADRIKSERDKEIKQNIQQSEFEEMKIYDYDFFKLALDIKKLERRLRQHHLELANYESNNNIDSKLVTQAKINKINEDLNKLKKKYKDVYNHITHYGSDKLLIQLINDYINQKNNLELKNEMYYALEKPNNTDKIKFLLKEGVDPNSQLHGSHLIFDSIMTPNNSENIRTLVNAGANINIKNMQSDNPLSMASRLPNNSENINTLLELGADPSLIDLSSIHDTNRDIREKEKFYQSRKPYLQMVEGTPESQGDIANYLSNEIIMRNISQYMNPDKGGKKTKKRQNHQKTKKSKKRKSGKTCKRKTRK
jgi:hypothetical protein